MTVVSSEYFQEILEPLRKMGIMVFDFTLLAAKETVEKRLKRRFDRNSWNFHQVDRCLSGLKSDVFSNKIDTDILDLYQVVENILQQLGSSVVSISGKNGRVARFQRRVRVLFSHIRISDRSSIFIKMGER
jgi:hypothetical protein